MKEQEITEEAANLNKIQNLLDWAKCGLYHNHPNDKSEEHKIFKKELEFFKSVLSQKTEPVTKPITDWAMKETAKEVRSPKCVRDGLVKEPVKGVEELISDEAITKESEKRFDLNSKGWHTRKKHFFKEGAFYLRDLLLPHLTPNNQQSEAVEFAEWIETNNYWYSKDNKCYFKYGDKIKKHKIIEIYTEYQKQKGINVLPFPTEKDGEIYANEITYNGACDTEDELNIYRNGIEFGWKACLDKIKSINQPLKIDEQQLHKFRLNQANGGE